MGRQHLVPVILLIAAACFIASVSAGCSCHKDQCYCCEHLHIPKVVDTEACLNLTVIPSTLVWYKLMSSDLHSEPFCDVIF